MVATRHFEIFVLKNRHAAELSVANCHATQPFETVTEKYSSSDVSTILFTDEKHASLQVAPKTPKNHQQ